MKMLIFTGTVYASGLLAGFALGPLFLPQLIADDIDHEIEREMLLLDMAKGAVEHIRTFTGDQDALARHLGLVIEALDTSQYPEVMAVAVEIRTQRRMLKLIPR